MPVTLQGAYWRPEVHGMYDSRALRGSAERRQMNKSALQRSQAFLQIADQFKLGELVTESAHPVTQNLSQIAEKDTVAALRLLFKVDEDLVRTYGEVVESGRMTAIADHVLLERRVIE